MEVLLILIGLFFGEPELPDSANAPVKRTDPGGLVLVLPGGGG